MKKVRMSRISKKKSKRKSRLRKVWNIISVLSVFSGIPFILSLIEKILNFLGVFLIKASTFLGEITDIINSCLNYLKLGETYD